MTSVAEGLQVFLIKEKDRIATVWLDVIDIRCNCEAPLLHALLAERVLRNKAITKLLPSILKTVESTLSQIRRRRARGTSGLWPSSP